MVYGFLSSELVFSEIFISISLFKLILIQMAILISIWLSWGLFSFLVFCPFLCFDLCLVILIFLSLVFSDKVLSFHCHFPSDLLISI